MKKYKFIIGLLTLPITVFSSLYLTPLLSYFGLIMAVPPLLQTIYICEQGKKIIRIVKESKR